MARVIMEDLAKIREEYGRERRTSIENAEEIVLEEAKVPGDRGGLPDGPLRLRQDRGTSLFMSGIRRRRTGENKYVFAA